MWCCAKRLSRTAEADQPVSSSDRAARWQKLEMKAWAKVAVEPLRAGAGVTVDAEPQVRPDRG
jgi:hypothetical protein